jgi:hypothetical protein
VTANTAKVTNATHTGEVTGATALTIAADAVTFAKMQNIATDSLIGRDTASTGDPEAITVTGGIEFSGSGSIRTSAFTGDVTKTAGGTALTIAADVVDNTKAANMATARIKGRVTAGTGDPEDLTGTQATTLLDTFTTSLKGLAPASGGGTTNFLRADGTWAAPPGGGGGSLTVQDEGSTLSTAVTTINFTGAGVTATGTTTVTVNVPGGGGGGMDLGLSVVMRDLAFTL